MFLRQNQNSILQILEEFTQKPNSVFLVWVKKRNEEDKKILILSYTSGMFYLLTIITYCILSRRIIQNFMFSFWSLHDQ